MADQIRGPSLALRKDITARPARYGFFQAMRLLRYFFQHDAGQPVDETYFTNHIRVRPELSLGFPGTDMTGITVNERDGLPFYHITATFLGLYGSSSPLPTFYTEDLIDDVNDDVTATREFLDIVNAPLYPLLIKAWFKYKLYYQINAFKNTSVLERLFSLFGLGVPELRDRVSRPERLLRYIGLFSQWPRSSTGLTTLISDVLGGARVEVEPNLIRRVIIPPDQRFYMGQRNCILGEDAHVGEQILDRMSKFGLIIGELDADAFHACLPGTETFSWLVELIHLYVSTPLECHMEIRINRTQVQPFRLGDPLWSVLVHDAWVYSAEPPDDCRALFELKIHGSRQ